MSCPRDVAAIHDIYTFTGSERQVGENIREVPGVGVRILKRVSHGRLSSISSATSSTRSG